MHDTFIIILADP